MGLRNFALIAGFLKRNFKEFLADSGNFWMYLVTILLYQSLFIIFLSVVFSQVPAVQGWSFDEMLFIYGFSSTVSGLFYLVFAWTLWFPESYIVERRLDIILTYPMAPYFYILLEGLGKSVMEVVSVGLGLVVMGFAVARMGMPITPLSVVQLITSLLAGLVLLGGLFTALTALSFWEKSRASLVSPLMYLMEFAQYPVGIYSPGLRLILTWVLPFAFVGFYPAAAFLRAEMSYFYPLTLAMGLLWFAGGYALWNWGLRRYESAGN